MIQDFKVFHVKLSKPVHMTDFWSTESIGVAVKPCCSEPDKSKKLESLKGHVRKSVDNGQLNEKKFPRKLSEK